MRCFKKNIGINKVWKFGKSCQNMDEKSVIGSGWNRSSIIGEKLEKIKISAIIWRASKNLPK